MVTAETFHRAIEFATKAHKGQYRKSSGRPYILHPIEVMSLAMQMKNSKNVFLIGTAAILHDADEDNDQVSIKLIAEEFGYAVASIVDELTTNKEECLAMGKDNYLLAKMLKMSSYALYIKLCDRYLNICEMKGVAEAFKEKYSKETRFIVDGLIERKLTKSHRKIIKLIGKELIKWQPLYQ